MLNYVDILLDSSGAGTSFNITGTRDKPKFTLQPSIENVVGMSVLSADVPFTYNVVDETNRYFSLFTPAGGRQYYIMTPGTYNRDTLAAHLTMLGTTTSGQNPDGSSNPTNSISFRVFVDSTDGRLVFQLFRTEDGTSFDPTTLFGQLHFSFMNSGPNWAKETNRTLETSAGLLLGFTQTSVINAFYLAGVKDNLEVPLDGYGGIRGTRSVDLNGPGQMFLQSDLGSLTHGCVRNQTTLQSIVGFWPVNSQYQGTIEYFREEPVSIPITRTTVSSITLSLALGNRLVYGNSSSTLTDYLQLNGEPFRVSIRFEIQVDEVGTSTDGNNVEMTVNKSNSYVKSKKPRFK